MADAVKVIDQEIEHIEQQLQAHSYHLYALRELRKKLNESPAGITATVTKPQAKTNYNTFQRRAVVVAKKVANYLRENQGSNMTDAIKALKHENKLFGYAESSFMTMCARSVLGENMHARIFKGTKYAK